MAQKLISFADKRASLCWILMWSALFSGMMALSKNLQDVNIVILVFIRSAFGLLSLSPVIYKNRGHKLKTKRIPSYVILISLTCFAMICTYCAYVHLPLATATSIGFTAPFIKIMLAIIFLNDSADWRKWVIITLGYIGVLVIVQPGYIEFNPIIIIALLANFFASCASIMNKKILETDSEIQVLFYSTSGRVLVLGILALYFWETPSLKEMLIMITLGFIGTLSNYCHLKGIKNAELSMLAPVEYTRLIFAIPIGIIFFSEIPTIWTFIGSAIIIIANFTLIVTETMWFEKWWYSKRSRAH